MTSLTQTLSAMAGESFAACGLSADFGLVRVSDRPDLAQFQCNGALAAAKQAGKNPRAVAEQVAANLKQRPEFSVIEIAGPGFINLNLTDAFLASFLAAMAQDGRLGVADTGRGATVILDYGGPNVAKAMHVGHLRPTIIGDSLKRIMRYAGYNALGDVHMGDWGLPMGQIISELEIRHPDWIYFQPGFDDAQDQGPPFTYAELEKIYPEASQACRDDPARLEQARNATALLQAGRPGYRALWRHFMTLSKADMKSNFDSVGVTFELWKGEADMNDIVPVVAEDLKAKNLAMMDQGALIVPVAKADDNKEMPPLMYFKSDGAVTYGTTDLATLYDREKTYGSALAQLVYVVDKRQTLHFEQVFRAASLAGYAVGTGLKFIGFGTLNGPDGKPFKTRSGGVPKFADLVGMVVEKALRRLEEADLARDVDQVEKDDIARKVGVSALKFADLSNQSHIDYVFDLDRMSSFEGKTGPYLLYQAVRIKSLLRKAAEQDFTENGALLLQAEDRPLTLLLTEFPDVFDAALRHYAPHHLCDYAFRLAQQFSSFYAACHILSETDGSLRASRLALCAATMRILETTLALLGIAVPERM